MEKGIGRIGEIHERLIGWLARFSGVLLVLVTLCVTIDVIARRFWDATVIGIVECSEHALVAITFLSAAWILKEDGHVRVDLVLGFLKPKGRALLNLGTSILGGALSMFIAYRATLTTYDLWQRHVETVKSLELPMAPLYVSICIGTFLLALQFLKNVPGYFRDWKEGVGRT